MTNKHKLKIALAIHDTKLKDFCTEIKRDKSTILRYVNNKKVEFNFYLEHKIAKLWDEAIEKLVETEDGLCMDRMGFNGISTPSCRSHSIDRRKGKRSRTSSYG